MNYLKWRLHQSSFRLCLIIFVLVRYESASSFNVAENCENVNNNTNCTCQEIKDSNFLVRCISSDLSVNQKIRMLTAMVVMVVRIECSLNYNKSKEYIMLPDMPTGYNAELEMSGCAMFGQKPIADKFDSLDIDQLYKLTIEKSNLADSLTRQHFSGLKDLNILNLCANNITQMPIEIFSDLEELVTLNLSSNSIEELEMGIFYGLRSLLELDLNNNRLKCIPAGVFQNLDVLIGLDLGRNQINVLRKESFQDATYIISLSLSSNNIIDLPADLFLQQHNLTFLDLSLNHLKTLPSNIFQNTKKLQVVSLSYNQLSEISSDHFALLEKLKILNIDNNHLMAIDPDAFYYCRLSYLNLENNQIQIKEGVHKFFYAHKVLKLNLRNNSITHFTLMSVFTTAIDISQNKITSLNIKDLMFDDGTQSTINVNITNNLISQIDFQSNESISLRRIYNVVTIDLNNNPLNCNCQMIAFVRYLRAEIGQNIKQKIRLNTNALRSKEPNILRGVYANNLDPAELLCQLRAEDCPSNCECWERTYKSTLIVNCTNLHNPIALKLPDPSTFKLHSIELYLSLSNIIQLPHNSTHGYSYVKQLYAGNNKVSEINENHLPWEITHLDLRRNHLQRLSERVLKLFDESPWLKQLYLSHNPWLCDCETKELLSFVQNNYEKIPDFEEIFCSDPTFKSKNFHNLSINDICPPQKILQLVIIIITIIGIAVAIILLLYYKYQQELRIWLYSRNLCICCVREEDLDKDKLYDAFVSYSHKDEHFIAEHLVPRLEQDGPLTFKLCIHVRDWIIGECIPDQIMRSIDQSRRTIILLTQNFIESVWARVEFRAAHHSAMNEKRSRLIVILYNKLNDIENIDPVLKSYLQMNTYLKWGDPYFWEKLFYAMPHRAFRRSVSYNFQETTAV